MRSSLQGKLVLLGIGALIAGCGVGLLVFTLWNDQFAVIGASTGLLAAILIWLIGAHVILRPVTDLVHALTDNIASMNDNDFSVSVANTRGDELGSLVAAQNKLAGVLRDERQSLYQRELLLDTVIQSTSIALVLVDESGKIVYSNAAARQLLWQGMPLNGETFDKVLAQADSAFGEAVRRDADGLFTIESDEPQTFHLSRNDFTLNVRAHRLYLFKHLTQELNRQEVATWKKVIRVISHELNNSLAPISSLAHSGAVLHGRQSKSDEHQAKLETIFSTIEERTSHLKRFIEGYARFARLPAPRIEEVEWSALIQSLQQTLHFKVVGDIPPGVGRFDQAQIEQVLINLIKNAQESGSDSDEVSLSVTALSQGWRLDVLDRGNGMTENVFASALLPFYSTKKSGTGLGLPLCREIVEAHGGRMSLANRPGGGLKVTLQIP